MGPSHVGKETTLHFFDLEKRKTSGKLFDKIAKAFGIEPTSYTLNRFSHITPRDFDDWDTIIHEYGHAIAQDNYFVTVHAPASSCGAF